MLESFPVSLAVGTVLGFLAGLGVGGGSLLILWLTLVIQMPYEQARVLNLLFFLPSAVISSVFRWKQGTLQPMQVLPGIIAGCIAAIACSWAGNYFDTTLLKKGFGILLLFTGLRELFYKPKETGQE